MKPITPEFTWALCKLVFWFGVGYTLLVNYLECYDATISVVIIDKTERGNFLIPAVVIGLAIHWFFRA